MAGYSSTSSRRRSPGEGSVYRNGDRWRGAVTWTEPDGSTHRRRVVSGATSGEARDKLDALRRELHLATIAPGRSVTVAEYLAGWVERDRARVRPATWRERSLHVRLYLTPALGRTALARLSPQDVERALAAFMASGAPGLSAGRRRPVSPSLRATRGPRCGSHSPMPCAMGSWRATRPPTPARLTSRIAPWPTSPLPTCGACSTRPRTPRTGRSMPSPHRPGSDSASCSASAGPTLTWRPGPSPCGDSMALAAAGGWELADPKSARSRRTIPLRPGGRRAAPPARPAGPRPRGGRLRLAGVRTRLRRCARPPLRPDRVSHAFTRARTAAGLPRSGFMTCAIARRPCCSPKASR